MSKLKIKLYNEGNIVIYRVLEQCESIIKGKETREFVASNGFNIQTLIYPEAKVDGNIYIRGIEENQNDCVSSVEFTSEEAAKVYVERALEAFKEFSENNYFSGVDKKEEEKEEHVYVF